MRSQAEVVELLDEIGQRALCKRETLWTTYTLAQMCCRFGIPGAFVECGVFGGAQVAAMWHGAVSVGAARAIHCLDTFTGIPETTPEDGEEVKQLVGLSACSVRRFKMHMQEWEVNLGDIVIHQGFIEDTVEYPEMPHQIAILRLDADLYLPTKAALVHLGPRVVQGGCIIVDDYSLPGVFEAVHEVMHSMQMAPLMWQVGQK